MKRVSTKITHFFDVRRPQTSIGSQGFSLVELLVTLLACAILIGAVSVAVNAQSSLSQRHRDMVIANSYATAKIEELRSQGFLALEDGSLDVTGELPEELNEPRNATVTITAHNASVKRVVLSITYNDRGSDRTYTYETLVGEIGVGQN